MALLLFGTEFLDGSVSLEYYCILRVHISSMFITPQKESFSQFRFHVHFFVLRYGTPPGPSK